MRLINCSIANFGVLSDVQYDFTDGLNVILEDNGTGKSTLAAFIKAMFYGLAATTKRDLDANERKHYNPWQGGTFGGSLTFETEEKTYRVERKFGATAAKDTFALYDMATGLASNDFSSNLGEELFGVDAASYEKSVWHPQKAVSFSQSSALTARLSASKEGEDAAVYERIKKELDARMARYENKQKRGLLPDARAKLQNLNQQIATSEAALERLAQLQMQLQSMQLSLQSKQTALSDVKKKRLAMHEAAERLARLDMWKSLSARVQEQKDKITNLETLFGGDAPALPQITRMQGVLQKAHAAREQSANTMRPEDFTRLASLRARFSEGVPDDFELQQMMHDAVRLDQANRQLEEEEAVLVTRRAQIADSFPSGVPTAAACAAAGQMALSVLKEEAKQQQELQNKKEQAAKLRKTLFIASGALAAAGAVLAIFLLWVGVAVFALAAAVLVYTLLAVGKSDQEEIVEIPMRDELLQFLHRYEQPFAGEDLLNGQLRVQGIAQRARQYEALDGDLAALRLRVEKVEQEKQRLQSQLSSMGQDVSDGFTDAVHAVMDAAAQYRALEQVRDQTRSRMAEASREAHAMEQEITAFCRRYGADLDGDEEDILVVLFERAQNLANAKQAYLHAKAELAAYENLQNINAASDAKPVDPAIMQQLKDAEERLTAEVSILSSDIGALKKEAEDLSDYAARLQMQQAEHVQVTETLAKYEQNLRTLQQTSYFLQQAYDGLRANYLTLMQKGLQKYAALVTGQDAAALYIDADFSVRMDKQGSLRDYAHFSRGQRDIFDICTRLALCDALFEKEKPFLVLDDPFANLDDDNLVRARQLLEGLAADRQILYLACHSSRA